MMARGSMLLALTALACFTSNVALARLADRPASEVALLALESPLADSHVIQSTGAPLAATFVAEIKTEARSAGDKYGQIAAQAVSTAEPPKEAEPTPQQIHTDYAKAMAEATESRKMLFIYFHDPQMTAARKAFETEALAALEIREKLKRYVIVELPTTATVKMGGKDVTLLKHASFAEMLGRSGVAVIDLAHVRAKYYGHVVSTFPFTPGKYYRKEALSLILDLPPGTLTQRTMIYAVRIHPEAPKSTHGQFHLALAEEAQAHSHHQASIQVQGHHAWDSRFHQINAKLPGNVLAQEVVAESWPNESLVEACVECVDSWRQSPGHWNAVRSRHPLFGFDIKRGRNGIWYATGIFGRRH